MSKPDFWKNKKRYYDFKSYLRNRFGCNVYKLQIDAGFTCPNRDGSLGSGGCIYCDGRGSKLRQSGPLPAVADQIGMGKALYRKLRGAVKFIAYFQTFTNTYAPVEKLKVLYDEALSQEDVIGIAVGTRPDCVDGNVVGLLEDYAKKYHVWVEYGLQSMHDATLRRINRGHDANAFRRAVLHTAGRGIYICAHVIAGLPGETRAQMLETARFVASLPIQGVKIHLLLALDGTVIGDLYKAGQIRMMEKDEYITTVCDILEALPPGLVIQRLTADGYRDIFLAPEWGRKKLDVLNGIDRELERRDSYQGKKYEARD
ncbi:MAG TPA: TIGR01212 family radical SAM protein [Syntrophales bacterium]|jgi:radical SAM protein (TIGR01212 family)|nr:TIGR01212 family radical SAM protein [Syntrophales bacterium]HOX95074.1 TIGR01212 family radical SAM protein [Syntrophales bacterium]HPI55765.1 TIGR01212 family radical SAM protein [Syntrophales bacterium]HPN23743.1 TIGR01212 family radical SAM protein [Syntrophales bacterium]